MPKLNISQHKPETWSNFSSNGCPSNYRLKKLQDKGFNLMVVSEVCWDTLKLKNTLKDLVINVKRGSK
jgi:hypothetical protein